MWRVCVMVQLGRAGLSIRFTQGPPSAVGLFSLPVMNLEALLLHFFLCSKRPAHVCLLSFFKIPCLLGTKYELEIEKSQLSLARFSFNFMCER